MHRRAVQEAGTIDTDQTPVTPGQRLAHLARERGDEPAVIVGMADGTDQQLSWAQLERRSNRAMHHLSARGVGPGSFVAIVLPNGVDHIVATHGALKLGACAMPINPRMPPAERDAMLALASPAAVVGSFDGAMTPEELAAETVPDTAPTTYPVPDPYKAVGSGGSTGRPKLIVSAGGFSFPVGGHPFVQLAGLVEGDVLYSTGPLSHNQAFLFALLAGFAGATLVLNERFDAARAFRLIREHGVTVLNTVPTVMLRLLRHDPDHREDDGSLRLLWHMASACPEWVKRGWIDRIGAEKVMELWAATEITGMTTIRGDEWLAHPGSVGRPWNSEAIILGPDGRELPAGQVGDLYTRFGGGQPLYRYLGADPLPTRPDGFASVGDLAWIDEDGFIHLADRRVDLIITGGANVYPAEVEAVITQDPRVRDVCVVGLADPEFGRTVHAIVEPLDADDPPDLDELRERLSRALTGYKVPRSWELVASLPRDDAGKIRRSALRDERDAAGRAGSSPGHAVASSPT